MPDGRTRYFAYGSNLCADQMARRCPAATAGEVVSVPGWRFVINRRGVATLLPDAASQAVGLIWHLTQACERALDGFEGVATGVYRKKTTLAGGVPALVYLAAEERPGPPRAGYLEGICAAAARLGLEEGYRGMLAGWGHAVGTWLVQEVLDGYRLDLHGIHGPGHWLRVRQNGLALAAMTRGADATVVELFALLHDGQRHDENRDRGHGERAAAHVRRLASDGLLRIGDERVDLLAEACAGHNAPQTSRDPTIGCCWDADRLELSRLWQRPIDRLLSTEAARDPAIQAAAWERGTKRRIDAEGAALWGLKLVLSQFLRLRKA